MKKLSRNQMRSLKGGIIYHCTVTFTDGTTETVNNVSASNEQQARLLCRGSHNNVQDSSCAPAGQQ